MHSSVRSIGAISSIRGIAAAAARSSGVAAFLLALVFAPELATQTKNDAQVFSRVIEAHGGMERFRAIRDWRIVAERRLRESAKQEVYEESMLRSDLGVSTLLVKRQNEETRVYGHDGRTGFVLENGVALERPGAEAEGYYRAHGEFYLRSLPFKWRDPGVSIQRLESSGDSGELLFEVRARDGTGEAPNDVWIAAVDSGSALLYEARLRHDPSQERFTEPRPPGITEITYRYSDYREVCGLRIAYLMEYYRDGEKTGENRIETMECDLGLSESLFTQEYHER